MLNASSLMYCNISHAIKQVPNHFRWLDGEVNKKNTKHASAYYTVHVCLRPNLHEYSQQSKQTQQYAISNLS